MVLKSSIDPQIFRCDDPGTTMEKSAMDPHEMTDEELVEAWDAVEGDPTEYEEAVLAEIERRNIDL